jgi:site-specific DNA-methyltransferase (adenine-specific)
MRELPDCSIDCVLTDPPYELGLMGRAWDQTGIAYSVEMWSECLRVLKPGGHLLAFSSTRTYHRMACAVEDAGFEIRDMVEWLYGTGLTKAKNIGCELGHASKTALGTALKPSHEPCLLARKPLSERTVALNVREHSTGALNIDACRVEGAKGSGNWKGVTQRKRGEDFSGFEGGWNDAEPGEQNEQGRLPANLICSEQAAVELDEQQAGISRFFFTAKPSQRERNAGLPGRNPHPTVKPIALMSYLIRLVCPAGGTLLDPFLGSGSTACAAVQEPCVGKFVGIDLDGEFVELSRARITHWQHALRG